MASFRAAGRMFCSAARAEAAPGSVSRWKKLINSKAGEKQLHPAASSGFTCSVGEKNNLLSSYSCCLEKINLRIMLPVVYIC